MSRQFSDTTTLSGLVQKYEDEIGMQPGDVSGNTQLLKKFVSSTRTAWDMYVYLAMKASGKWQFDDANHTDYPIIKTNLVQGQRDYTFSTDETGNLILDIFRVAILPSATATEYQDIYPLDEQSGEETALNTEDTAQGVSSRYDKTGNAIRLEVPPSYNATSGLKAYINREASYFTTSDTTKKPGCPGIHHDYFYLRPAMEYARKNRLDNYQELLRQVVSFEGDEARGIQGSIERHFSRRSRDERKVITHKPILYI